MISANQVSGLPETMADVNKLKDVEIESVPGTEIDEIFTENNEPNIQEEE